MKTKSKKELRRIIAREYENRLIEIRGEIHSYFADFDELHLLQKAKRLTRRISEIQERHARWTATMIEEYLWLMCHDREIIKDKQYPVLETLLNNHAKIASRCLKKVLQYRGDDKKSMIDEVIGYLRKAVRNASDTVMVYEIERVRVDQKLKVGKFFRTVCVKDGKACPVCLAIEQSQKDHPVPVREAMTGVNCPPFHPYCRCSVEVFYGISENNK